MTSHWPYEKEADEDKNDKFLSVLETFSQDLPAEFDQIVEWILNQAGSLAELESRVNAACDQVEIYNHDGGYNLIMTWLCAISLSRLPHLETWMKIKSFIYHSSVLEHDLPLAMMTLAESSSDIKDSYLKLALKVLSKLENSSLKSKSSPTNEERDRLIQYWKGNSNKLEEVWWGLRGDNGFSYWEDYALLHILANSDPAELMQTLSRSNNPYLVQSVLLMINAVGPFSQFAEWEKYIHAAPVAFKEDGDWNESLVVPLLLVGAYTRLIDAQHNIRYADASENIDESKENIISLINAIVDILSDRNDAIPLFCRWSTWLMRLWLSESGKNNKQDQLQPFVTEELINAIGIKLKNHSLMKTIPSGASQWEHWCYQCVLAWHAADGLITVPDTAEFVKEWTISFDDWNSDKGSLLRKHANLLMTLNKNEMPGQAENLLAYPLAQSESPTDTWINIWNNIYVLREVVEFGDGSSEAYKSKTDASNLLLMMFRIGLAIFDQRTDLCSDCKSTISKSQARLFGALFSAGQEMQEIDSTLNYKVWLNAILHLSIRRYLWEQQLSGSSQSGHPLIFCSKDTPTILDCFYKSKRDVLELVKFLQSILMNEIDIPTLKNNLDKASVNVSDVLDEVKRLNMYDSRRYPVDLLSLKELEDRLLDNTDY